MRVAVVGGGLTGLTAAYRLVQRGCDVRLLEGSERTGGIVATARDGERVFELGPDCFLTGAKPWAHDLAVELGLEPVLIRTSPEHRRSLVLTRGRLEPIPRGFHLIAPTALAPFLRSPILSRAGKLRAVAELALAPAPREDESLRSFVVRRFGRELFRRLAEPLVAGIYTADPRELSLRATFPQFLDMERDAGSVTRALWNRAVEASGARYGLFASFRGGVETLTRALRAKLPEGVVSVGDPVRSVRREAGGILVVESAKTTERFERVIVALPAPSAAAVVESLDGELSRLLRAVPYAGAATVNFLFRREQVRHPLDAMGFVCPSIEKRFILACSFSSTKFAGRVGSGEVLLRAFVGGAQHADRIGLEPATIAERALGDLEKLLGITGAPLQTRLHVWKGAMPQYTLGHLDRVAAVEAQVTRTQGLAFAGNALRGVGLPDCIRSADAAVRTILAPTG